MAADWLAPTSLEEASSLWAEYGDSRGASHPPRRRSGNLCRSGSYLTILDAVREASEVHP